MYIYTSILRLAYTSAFHYIGQVYGISTLIMKVILLLMVFLLMELDIKQVCGAKQKVFCVGTKGSKPKYCQNGRWVSWSAVSGNDKKYFNSYTKLFFSPVVYNLDKLLLLQDVENLTLAGIRSSFTINCTNTGEIAALVILHAAFVQISNAKFQNCGGNIHNVINNSLSEANAAIVLSEITSIVMLNVTFENVHGHAIVGLNLVGSSVLKNVKILNTHDNGTANETRNACIGGFIFAFYDTRSDEDVKTKVNLLLLENCSVINVQQKKVFTLFPLLDNVLKSSAIGLLFKQNTYDMIINICHFNITNVISNNGPLIFIQFNSESIKSSIIFSHSSFTRNSVEHYPIIYMLTFQNGYNVMSQNSTVYYFKLHHCELSFNTVQFIGFIEHKVEDCKFKSTFVINSTKFTYNIATEALWKVIYNIDNATILGNLSFLNSKFLSNIGFTIQLCFVANLTLIMNNVFFNNSVNYAGKKLFEFNETIPKFEGYNNFTFNTADIIMSLNNYIIIKEYSSINFLYNNALENPSMDHTQVKTLIYSERGYSIQPCLFQFLSTENLDKVFQNSGIRDSFTVRFKNNTGYNNLIFGAQLNSCYWLRNSSFKILTPGTVYNKVLQYDTSEKSIIGREVGTLCYCSNETNVDCLRDDNFGFIYPGQTIPICFIRIPHSYLVNTAIYSSSSSHDAQLIPYEPCPSELKWLQLLHTNCTPIDYRVYSSVSLMVPKKCYVSFRATYPDDSFYIYYVDFKDCPLGFTINNGSCDCDEKLKVVFPSLKCNIQTQTFTRPGKSWIGLSEDKNDIKYTKFCAPTVCIMHSYNVTLDEPDTQCNFNRGGMACGYCPPGLDAVFGSLKCKKCSNYWLFLLPVFMIAGILLVLFLFTLNLTVVDGKINGFILYINAIVVHIHIIFPTSRLAVIISLVNLDLGIEACFYRGMTEYDKTWLLFAFPSYLLFIIAILAFASRYSSSVERLTRSRVIPVIATIFLLTYSKLLLATTKVFFSYMTIYSLSAHQNITVWTWDPSVRLFGVKYTLLFLASLLILLRILLPLNFFLLFTRPLLRLKCVAKYIKPYLDAFQAPFKDNCRYFPGIELTIRFISFAIGNRFLESTHRR